MKQTNKQHEESGCTDYLQHSADSCPLLTATAAPEAPTNELYDSDQYDTEAIATDRLYNNFSEDRLEDYRHENIVRASLINGQFTQARKQCVSYGLNYELERYKFDHE